MTSKLFLLLFLLFSSLFAETNLDQLKQAVEQNPALLNTPQAQAMMREKGVSVDEIQRKLEAGDIHPEAETLQQKSIKNDISLQDDNLTQERNNTQVQRLNVENISPFSFQSNAKIRENLIKKQQSLAENKLSRYSMRFYINKNQVDSSSLPTPDDYVISSGDVFNINIYGDRDKDYLLDVKNDGAVTIPFLGPIKLGGMSFKDAKKHLEKVLGNHYKMSSFNISISKYSTIQVTLIGEVKAPGLYNLSSFSTVKDLLITASGIQSNGSVRDIVVKRNSKIVAHLDFYDLLFNGEEFGTSLLKHGDTVIINQAKILVSIDGYVNNSAIFELKENENLDKLIEYASGMKPNASKVNIKVKRYSDNALTQTFNIASKEAKNFKMLNGDSVYIYPLDFSAQSSVNIYGNIIRPGSYDLSKEKTLNALLQENIKHGMKKFFLPQTHFEYAVIKSYDNSLKYTTRSVNLAHVLNNSETVQLSSQDEIFIFSQNDIYSNSFITTIGKTLMNPGKLQYFHGMTVQDAINASGLNKIIDDKVRITTFNTEDNMPQTKFISLKKNGYTQLSPYDEVEIYDFYDSNILKPVIIKGEVVNPTTTYYEEGMNAAKLLNISGGFTNKAYRNKLEIVRYFLDANLTRQREILGIDLTNTNMEDVIIKPFDEVTVFKIPKWGERKTVTLLGQVQFPGTYTIDDGEKLVDILKRAGGFTDKAFIEGAVFTRESIKQNQMDQYNKSLARIKRELAIYNAMPANAKKSASMGQASNTLNEVIQEAQKYQPIGRVSINLDENLTKIEQSNFNIVLNDKDTLAIPSSIDTVTVFGEVFNPSSFIYDASKNSEDYIVMASGFSKAADIDNSYIIHANGTSEPLNGGWLSADVDIKKGDTIVVPIYIKEYDALEVWDSVSKILSSFAITAAALNSLGIITQ
ncbi:SLBB domain-containing protein [bacterium]|nr:SLBB domain-containing protein [bacterium]MBU1995304.1 SLBB domain-containing protein [bacterium]